MFLSNPKNILSLILFLVSTGCTVINIYDSYGNTKTSYWPGFAYIKIPQEEKPIYFRRKTLGISIESTSFSLGYYANESVYFEKSTTDTCLFIEIPQQNSPISEFMFSIKDTRHAYKQDRHN